MNMQFNDKMGHSGRKHINLIAARLPDGKQVIFTFTGKPVNGVVHVNGVVQVVREDYNKNRTWSATYWDVELADGVVGFTIDQDWETGKWINSKRWQEAIIEFRGNEHLDEDAIERFIRSEWNDIAELLDAASTLTKEDGTKALLALMTAQNELIAAQNKSRRRVTK